MLSHALEAVHLQQHQVCYGDFGNFFGKIYSKLGYRPIIKVGLREANGEPFELGVLVDYGADISIFSRRIGDIRGIDVER